MMMRELNIDVFFDFICPWCLIGKRQLQAAIAQLQQSDPEVEVNVHWHSMQLLPEIPVEGVDFNQFYQKRLGSLEAVKQRQTQVRQAAKTVGVELHFEKIQWMPNTAQAHHMFQNVFKLGTVQQAEHLLEQLFAVYFEAGENLGDSTVLKRVLKQSGYSVNEQGRGWTECNPAIQSTYTGANGVPYFIFDGYLTLAGAHSVDVIYQAMLEALVVQG